MTFTSDGIHEFRYQDWERSKIWKTNYREAVTEGCFFFPLFFNLHECSCDKFFYGSCAWSCHWYLFSRLFSKSGWKSHLMRRVTAVWRLFMAIAFLDSSMHKSIFRGSLKRFKDVIPRTDASPYASETNNSSAPFTHKPHGFQFFSFIHSSCFESSNSKTNASCFLSKKYT